MTKTKIEWTDETWNPTTGCTKVSPGCDHCYAEGIYNRFHGPGAFDTITMHPDRIDAPLGWRQPRRVFVNSMSDLFHEDIPDAYIARVFAVMAAGSRHTFQVLTKRHGRMRALLSSPRWAELLTEAPEWPTAFRDGKPWGIDIDPERPLDNVWLGVSVEDQKWADIRIPALLETPAAVRFLSCEPLLGPIDLAMDHDCGDPPHMTCPPTPDWCIVGGESGRSARPMHPTWARDLRNQCQQAGVPYFFKQWGEWAPGSGRGTAAVVAYDGEVITPPEARWTLTDDQDALNRRSWEIVHRTGKHAAGRVLDGRTWDEYPVADG